METKFLSIKEKSNIIELLKSGDNYAVDYVISEIDRLENIIKGYEYGIYQINIKFNSDSLKTPKKQLS